MSAADNNRVFAQKLSLYQPTSSNIGPGFEWSLDNATHNLKLASYNPTDRTSTTDLICVSAAGFLGIGTASPEADLHVTGDAKVDGNLYNLSDIRFKTDLVLIQDALQKVSTLSGYTFKRTDLDESRRFAGVIAQDVKQVLPEAISTNRIGIMSVAYDSLIPLLIESIKDLKAQVNTLQNQVADLQKQ